MAVVVLVVMVGLVLGYANGANDNFKGVATLFGSGSTSYRSALGWAALTTGLGAMTALILARGLLTAFSGKGLVPAEVLGQGSFPAAVALAAGLTVLLATRFGFPISTTHALIGALVGAGLAVSPSGLHGEKLVRGFVLPLVVSPFMAVALAILLYPVFRFFRRRWHVEAETCLCLGPEPVAFALVPTQGWGVRRQEVAPVLRMGTRLNCQARFGGRWLGLEAATLLNAAHFLSAGAVCFARGLNDTPKIAALLLFGGLVSPNGAIAAVGLVMVLGGLLHARAVAETMARKVTSMNAGQGFTANLVTALLVIGASRFGLPVSTTHVSCGSLFGIGAVTGQARWRIIGQILLAWAITLPLAGLLAAGLAFVFKALLG